MGAIYRREMQSYFYTPAAYVFLGVFLALSSVFFGITNLASRSGNLLALLAQLSYLWMLLSPILTMRLMAGEKPKRPMSNHFAEGHTDLVDKLSDLEQILYKYIPGDDIAEELNELVFAVLQLSSDLQKHALIEEKILLPYISQLERRNL